MKNPLQKRYLRELKSDFGKYIVIFVLLVVSIGFVSGFEVADASIMKAYQESFEKYHVEDGHFETERAVTKSQKDMIEKQGIFIEEMPYVEINYKNDTCIRIFETRQNMNLECVMQGELPKKTGEIALDRMYAENNALSLGDTIIDKEGNSYRITGLVALSDYSALFQSNNDLMFDAVKFGVGVVSHDQFLLFDSSLLVHNYAWKYEDASIVGSRQEEDVSKNLMQELSEIVVLKNFIPRYLNQAITFTGEDMGSDGAMMIVFLDIIVIIVAFVYAITTKDTIQKEATVIGTLRASGFTVSELVKHYMVLPVFVTFVSAVAGNILGYTFLKDVCAAMYYGSYSLVSYTTMLNADAFIQTTLIPCLIMTIVTWIVLKRSLSLSPLQFLRNDLHRKKRKHAFPLKHGFPFFSRFRLRINFQNISNYLILFTGILFGNLLLMFGLALPDILNTYQEDIKENMIAPYQTILSVPSKALDENNRFQSVLNLLKFSKAAETQNQSAEKFSAYTLETIASENIKSDEVMLYGIQDHSKYVKLPGNGIYISSLYADKYDLGSGDEISLIEKYDNKEYVFKIDGIIDYKGSISIFMPQKKLNAFFSLSNDFFAGYFSETEITDIPSEYIGSVIDYDSLTKITRQLNVSMGSMMYVLDGFCVGLFIVLMYLLSKIVIEKNTQSISMVKILGYSDHEIQCLYIRSMTLVVLACILISIPLCNVLLVKIYRVMLKEMMTGWIMFAITPKIYLEMIGAGFLAYLIVAWIEIRKIKHIPMSQALKNVE